MVNAREWLIIVLKGIVLAWAAFCSLEIRELLLRRPTCGMNRCILCPIQPLPLPFLSSVGVEDKCRGTSTWDSGSPRARQGPFMWCRFGKSCEGLPLPSWHGRNVAQGLGFSGKRIGLRKERKNGSQMTSPMSVVVVVVFSFSSPAC